MAIPTVTSEPVTNISHASAIGHGTITDTGGVNATARGIEANAVAILSSGELAGLVGDGAVVSGGYIYMTCRYVSGGHHVFKIDTSDYSYIFADPAAGDGSDAICVAGGFLWVGSNDFGVVYKLSLVDLSTVDTIAAFGAGEAVTAMCCDGTYIYCGCDGAGHWARIKISDSSVVESVDTLPAGWYIHSLCIDGGYLYGTAENILETYSKAFKVDASTLGLDTSVDANNPHADDIAQDATYFYVISSYIPPKTGVTRFRKADLDETILSVTDMRPGDGLALIDGKLIAGWGQYALTYGVNWLWIADQAAFTEYNRVAISGDTLRGINNVLVDGDYIHVQQFKGTATRGVYFNKYKKADILTDLIVVRELGDFGVGAFSELIAGLTPETDYRVKAYAQNPDGYGYGGGADFTTTAIIAIRQGGHNAALLVSQGLI